MEVEFWGFFIFSRTSRFRRFWLLAWARTTSWVGPRQKLACPCFWGSGLTRRRRLCCQRRSLPSRPCIALGSCIRCDGVCSPDCGALDHHLDDCSIWDSLRLHAIGRYLVAHLSLIIFNLIMIWNYNDFSNEHGFRGFGVLRYRDLAWTLKTQDLSW